MPENCELNLMEERENNSSDGAGIIPGFRCYFSVSPTLFCFLPCSYPQFYLLKFEWEGVGMDYEREEACFIEGDG